MNKKGLLAVSLLLCAGMLCACSGEKEPETHYQVATITAAPTQAILPTDVPTAEPAEEQPAATEINWDAYDPTQEEGKDAPIDLQPSATSTVGVLTINSAYAGASPVVIDPIDKPTASPVPEMKIASYATYDALNLGLSFQGPAGWQEESNVSGMYRIVNPDLSVDFQAHLTITVESGSMNEKQMTTAVKSYISTLKSNGDYKSISSTSTANRTLLDAKGVYADYTATLATGAKIYGRVHIACLNSKIYTVHTEYPYDYREVYKTSLYNKMRSTIKLTK